MQKSVTLPRKPTCVAQCQNEFDGYLAKIQAMQSRIEATQLETARLRGETRALLAQIESDLNHVAKAH